MCLGGSRFFQVCLFLRHNPDQGNHKRSLLRKEEDNNQANDNLEQVDQIHLRLPFQQGTAKAVTKKPPGWAAPFF